MTSTAILRRLLKERGGNTTVEDLLAEIEKEAAQIRAEQYGSTKIGNLHLPPGVKLSRVEAAILDVLVQANGAPCDRDLIYNVVYEQTERASAKPKPSVIKVHVSHIRRKMAGKVAMLHTPGKGYYLRKRDIARLKGEKDW